MLREVWKYSCSRTPFPPAEVVIDLLPKGRKGHGDSGRMLQKTDKMLTGHQMQDGTQIHQRGEEQHDCTKRLTIPVQTSNAAAHAAPGLHVEGRHWKSSVPEDMQSLHAAAAAIANSLRSAQLVMHSAAAAAAASASCVLMRAPVSKR